MTLIRIIPDISVNVCLFVCLFVCLQVTLTSQICSTKKKEGLVLFWQFYFQIILGKFLILG